MTTAAGPRPTGRREGPRPAGERARPSGTNAFTQGADAAVAWLARGGPAPLTGCSTALPVSAAAVEHEVAAGDLVLAGPPGPGRRYAEGVTQALRRARGLDGPPAPRHSASGGAPPGAQRP